MSFNLDKLDNIPKDDKLIDNKIDYEPSRLLMRDMDTKAAINQYAMKTAEYIQKSEALRQDINKRNGKEPVEDTLLKALECISLMTGDTVFFEINKKKIFKKK